MLWNGHYYKLAGPCPTGIAGIWQWKHPNPSPTFPTTSPPSAQQTVYSSATCGALNVALYLWQLWADTHSVGLHTLYGNSDIMEMAMKWCGHWNFTTISKARVYTHDYHTNGFVTTRCITIATSIGTYSPSVLIEVLRMWWQFWCLRILLLPSYVVVILTTHGITVCYWVELVGVLAVLSDHE